jgi:protein O-GlcNAc transferase
MKVYEKLQIALQHYQAGRFQRAQNLYKEILNVQPNNVEALHFLSIIFQQKKDYDAAILSYRKAIRHNPRNAGAYYNLGLIFQEKGKVDEAITNYQQALSIKPDFANAYYNLGLIYHDKGDSDSAISNYQVFLQFNPGDADAYLNLGHAYQMKGQLDEATKCFQKAVELNANLSDAYVNLGHSLKEQGRLEEALAIYDKVLALTPKYVKARWAKCMTILPVFYPNYSSIQTARRHYCDELIKLQTTISLDTPKDIEASAEAVGSQQPFHLSAQGFNDRELQQIYGSLVCKIMAYRYPQFANRPVLQRNTEGELLRIGIVSGYFHRHSNWKIPIRGWIENIDKKRFSLYGYYTGNKKDKVTEDARHSFVRFIEDINSFEDLCRIIKEDNLHALIYPEIGMDPKSIRLAALRLAPIQCASWGHPDTSGLPTIDYFLSSDLMEPPDADSHYTEELVRLPNLSIYYTPLDLPSTDIDRKFFNLRQNSILYLCCQALHKYQPQYDEIYPHIAEKTGNCQFLFISHKSSYITEQFRVRIYKCFEKFALRPCDYVVFLPRLDAREYTAIDSLADIYLDSIGWSGCNTTLEAIACNLPVVTLPGELMRGRHSSAILNMMNIHETVACSLHEYIQIAVRLGIDIEWRKQISEKISANKHLVYRDKTCITALEDFLETVVKEKLK